MYDALNTMEADKVQRDRVKEYNDKAKIVKQKSEELISYLETWKTRIIDATG